MSTSNSIKILSPENRIHSNAVKSPPVYVYDLNSVLPLQYSYLSFHKVLSIFSQYLLFIFYRLLVCDIFGETRYDIYIFIWNVINFLCHASTKPPAPIFWLPDPFYCNAGCFFLILKYFYLPPVQLEVLSYLFGVQSSKKPWNDQSFFIIFFFFFVFLYGVFVFVFLLVLFLQ